MVDGREFGTDEKYAVAGNHWNRFSTACEKQSRKETSVDWLHFLLFIYVHCLAVVRVFAMLSNSDLYL